MKISKPHLSLKNLIFLVLIVLLLVPKTRQPIQIWLNKGLARFSPSIISETKQQVLTDYNWQLQTQTGALFNFENAKGKVVLVNFWATWCPPCIAEMPSLDALYSDYNDRVVFIFVSNESPEKINAFLKDKNYSFEPFTPLTQSPEFFNVTSIPRTFLIDKSGHVVIDKTGASNWYSDRVRNTIDALLSEDLK